MNALQEWLFAIVFFLPPFLMLYFSLQSEFSIQLQENQALKKDQIKKYFNDYYFNGTFYHRLESLLNNICNFSKYGPNPERAIYNTFQNLKKTFPSVFEIAIFNSEKRFLPEYSDLPEYHTLLASFGTDLKQFFQGNQFSLKKNMDNYLPLFGTFLPIDFFSNTGRHLFFRSFQKKRQFLYVSERREGRPSPWMMVWISGDIDLNELGYDLIKLGGINFQPAFQKIIDLKDPKDESIISELLPLLNSEEQESFIYKDQIWAQKKISSSKRFIASIPDEGIRNFNNAMSELNRNIALGFLLLLFSFRFFSLYTSKYSLKTKLMFIFSYTTIVPIILFGISARNLINEKQINLVKKLEIFHERILEEADRKILEYCSTVEKFAKKLGVSGIKSVQLQQFLDKFEPNLVNFYDRFGKEISRKQFSLKDFSGNPGPFLNFLPKIDHLIAKQLLKKMNPKSFSIDDSPVELAERTSVESFGADVSELLCLFEINFEKFFCISFGEDQFYVLNILTKNLEGEISGGMFFLWANKNWNRKVGAFKDYFRKKYPGRRLEISTGFNENPLIPHSWEHNGEMLPIHQKMVKDGKNVLISSMKGFSVIDKNVFIESSLEPIQSDISKMKHHLMGIAIILLGFGLSTSVLFGFHILHPLRNLTLGMEEMKSRNFSTRLPVLNHDELGKLTTAFNEMMEGMSDLEVGKIVQETFFPRESMKCNSWEIYGYSDSANKLGGDYFDYFPLKDGRLLFLIGDVTGGGVQAALVVGLVKALIIHPENSPSPCELLEMLNEVLFKIFKGNRCMTCFLGIFSPIDKILLFSNAGHLSPLQIENGKIEEITIRQQPLGSSSNSKFFNTTITLEEHSGFFFFTDGIHKSLNKALPHLMKKSSFETVQAIRGWHKKETNGAPLTEDATIMVLQKMEVESSQAKT
ncbi:MAG: SpoIIE family protein phosphatase [Candidatus Riflebacteria bacterium]|nr:SpoIIE family protein phosphatase [Candidatus Riflebacteria bacterium]